MLIIGCLNALPPVTPKLVKGAKRMLLLFIDTEESTCTFDACPGVFPFTLGVTIVCMQVLNVHNNY